MTDICFCRQDTVRSGHSAMVFRHGPMSGEHYIVTKDLDVGPMSIVQFDVSCMPFYVLLQNSLYN